MDLLINFRSLADQLDAKEFESFTRVNADVIVDVVLKKQRKEWIIRQLFEHLLEQQQNQSTASIAATSTSTLIESISEILRKNDNPAKKETDKLPLKLSNLTKGLLGSIASYLKLGELRKFMTVNRICYVAGSSPIAWSGYNSMDIPCDIEPYYNFCTSVQHRAFNIQWFQNVRNMTTGDLGENRFAEIMRSYDDGEVIFKNLKILRIGGDFDEDCLIVNPFGAIVNKVTVDIPIVLGLNCLPKETLESLELEGLCDREAVSYIFGAIWGFPNIKNLKLTCCGDWNLAIGGYPDIARELSKLTKYASYYSHHALSQLIINSKCKQLEELVIEDDHDYGFFPEINADAAFDALEVFEWLYVNQVNNTSLERILRTAQKLKRIKIENYFHCALTGESIDLLARLKSLEYVWLREVGDLSQFSRILEQLSDRILKYHQQDRLKYFSLTMSAGQLQEEKFKDFEDVLIANIGKVASILLPCAGERFSVRLEYNLDDEADQIDCDNMKAKMMTHIIGLCMKNETE